MSTVEARFTRSRESGRRDRAARPAGSRERPLRIAMLAPPWITIPAPGYGGVEAVVASLTDALVARGHEVTLFSAPGSRSTARVAPLLAAAHPDEIERALYEVDHVARAFAAIDAGSATGPYDVVHDHCGFTGLAMADRLTTPLVHTLHGPFTRETGAFYAEHGHKGTLVAISDAQLASAPAGLHASGPVFNPIALAEWPLQTHKGDYLLWIGRFTPEKGPQRAIAAAKLAGVPLVLAGVVQPGHRAFFDEQIAPHIDGAAVRFIGEVAEDVKRQLFAGARALLMPIRWDEPFGMVVVEALASGTPVIAFPEGAVRELVVHGLTGYLVADVAAMADAVVDLPAIAPADCRGWVAEHCDVAAVARQYEAVYRSACAAGITARLLHV